VDSGPVTETDLEAYLSATLARQLPRVGGYMLVLMMAWWPLDLLVWSDPTVPWVLSRGRLMACVFAAALLVFPPGRRLLELHPLPVGVAATVMLAGVLGSAVAPLGAGFLPFVYVAPMLSVGFSVELRVRATFTFTLAAVAWAGAFVANPPLVHHPMWASYTSFLVFLCCASVMMGEVHHRLTCADFYQQAELRRQRADLQRLNRELSDRVSEQTAELRGLALRLQATRDDERKWVARELREETTRQIEALRRSLSYARARLDPNAKVAARALDDGQQHLDETVATIGRILEKLRLQVDGAPALADSLQWLAEDLTRRTGIQASWENGLPPDNLPPSVVELAYKVAVAGLEHVARHARATSVLVRARADSEALVILVDDDDGRLAAASPADASSEGALARLAIEIARIGGHLERRPGTLGGTQLEARLPLVAPVLSPRRADLVP
jgi:signal transduction histidine kinase